MTESGLTRNLPGTRKSRNDTRYQNQEVENSSNRVPYREQGTEPDSSGLNQEPTRNKASWYDTRFEEFLDFCFRYLVPFLDFLVPGRFLVNLISVTLYI